MHSVYKLNKQGDNKQPCHTSLSVLNQSVVRYRILTVVSWPVYRFLSRWVRWSGIPISLEFSTVCYVHTVKGFSIVSETGRFFSGIPLFSLWSSNYWQYDFSAFSKPSLNIWKFSVHVMLKPSMQEFEYNLTSMGDDCNCLVVWTFFSTALLGNWDEDWTFAVLWPLLDHEIFALCFYVHGCVLVSPSW